jgi:hypothetical protein
MKRRRRAIAPIDMQRVRTYPLKRRASVVAAAALGTVPRPGMKLGDFLDGLPRILGAADLRAVAAAIADRHTSGRTVALGMGAHPIKVGLSPLIVDLMERGILSAVAMNGACIIHDFELAYHGATSEDVAASLDAGKFGMARETGEFLNRAIAAHAAAASAPPSAGRSSRRSRRAPSSASSPPAPASAFPSPSTSPSAPTSSTCTRAPTAPPSAPPAWTTSDCSPASPASCTAASSSISAPP